MQIGKQDEAFAKVGILLLDRLFDLDDRLGLAPDVAGIANDLGTGILVLGVGKAGQLASVSFDQHLVSRPR